MSAAGGQGTSGSRMPEDTVLRGQAAEKRGPIARTPTEARQGEIILGRTGRWIWIGSFVLILVIAVVLGFWQ